MGIQNLLPLLKPAMKEVGLREFKGKKVAVDGNVWVHRGAYSCALELHCNQDEGRYIGYCRHNAQLLLDCGIHPVVVFDGKSLGAKSETARRRAEGRRVAVSALDSHIESLRELEMQANGRAPDPALQHAIGAAKVRVEKAAQSTIKVTPDMVEKVMAALRQMGVQVLRAPYEADAQLAYLARNRHVAAVLTEDSDLIAYACPTVLTKFDRHSGSAMRLNWEDIKEVKVGNGPHQSLRSFTESMFLELCILCGCDYIDSIDKIGPKSAVKFMSKYQEARRVIKHIQVNKPNGARVPSEYLQGFQEALFTFRHMRVWSHTQKQVVHLTEPLTEGFEGDVDVCCGAPVDGPAALEWVYAGHPPSANDPFSKAAAAAAAAAGPSNPFQVQPRGARGARSSPRRSARKRKSSSPGASGGGSSSAGGIGITGAPKTHLQAEAEALMADVVAKHAGSEVRLEQFDDDDALWPDAEGGDEWEPSDTPRKRFDPAYAQPVPRPPTIFDDEADESGGTGAAGAGQEGIGGGAGPSHSNDDGAYDDSYAGLYEEEDERFHEPSVEELVDYSSSQAPPPPKAKPSPRRLGDALRPSSSQATGGHSLSQSLGAVASPGARNPFAGKRKRAAPALPPGTGAFDALHPDGALNSASGAASSGRRASKRQAAKASPGEGDQAEAAAQARAAADADAAAWEEAKAVAAAADKAEREAMNHNAAAARRAAVASTSAGRPVGKGKATTSGGKRPASKGKSPSTTQSIGGAGKGRTAARIPASKPAAKASGLQQISSFFGRS